MNRKIYRWCAPLLAAAALTACGGGGGGGGGYYPPPVATNPPPATNPYDNFISYVMGLVQTALDTAEPADVTAYDPPPTSDTNEPISTQ